jgi:hypothetical protein
VIPALPVLALAASSFHPRPFQGDPTGTVDGVFLEVETPRHRYYVHEPFELCVRLGVEKRLVEEFLVQPFQRSLDVPVRLEAPWLEGLPGTELLGDEDSLEEEPGDGTARGGKSLVLNEDRVVATQWGERVREGREYLVVEVRQRYLPLEAGVLEFRAPCLRYTFATEFEEDFFGDLVPGDRREGVVTAAGPRLTIVEPPAEGRPAGWSGAVGRFTLQARVARCEETVIELVLRIEGSGDLTHFEAPRLEELEPFHVLGKTEVHEPGRRILHYELVPVGGLPASLPPISFCYFDPTPPGEYRTVSTGAIPLEGADVAREGTTRGSPAPSPPRGPARRPSSTFLMLVLFAPPALLLAIWALLRNRHRLESAPEAPPSPPPEPTSVPLPAQPTHAPPSRERLVDGRPLRESVGGKDADARLAEALAARLRCSVPAVIAPDLEARLVRAGVPEDLAGRSARLLEELVAARYGGRDRADAAAAAEAILQELGAVPPRRV